MNRIEHVRMVAEKHGATLAEYLVLHIATAFAMTTEQAAEFLGKALERSAYAKVDCPAAVQSCKDRGWVGLSPHNMLVLTPEGMMITHAIANQLTEPRGQS